MLEIELNINMNFKNLNLEFYKLGGNDYKSQSGIIDVFPALRIITRYLETKENKKLKLNNVILNQCNEGLQVIILNNYFRKDFSYRMFLLIILFIILILLIMRFIVLKS